MSSDATTATATTLAFGNKNDRRLREFILWCEQKGCELSKVHIKSIDSYKVETPKGHLALLDDGDDDDDETGGEKEFDRKVYCRTADDDDDDNNNNSNTNVDAPTKTTMIK